MSTSPPSASVPPAVAYLRTLPAVRERCSKIFASAASSGGLTYFNYDETKEDIVADYCIKIIQRDYGTNYASIPPHGRWRHFDVDGIPRITTLLSEWAGVLPSSTSTLSQPKVEPIEAARRLVDLFMVSVLLDAGAGPTWKYEERKTGLCYGRSEGLAVASLDMFTAGRFCGETTTVSGQGNRYQVNAAGLKNLSPDTLAIDMQVHPTGNPMTGLEGRTELLTKLGDALALDPFGFFTGPNSSLSPEQRRPGFLVDYLSSHPTTQSVNGVTQVNVPVLWEVLMYGLAPIWPASRTKLDNIAMGDVWPNHTLAQLSNVTLDDQASMVPFHKLSQWLCYSLIEAMEKTLNWHFIDGQHATGLPEYRNGGLFIDLGVLTPKPALLESSTTPLNQDENQHQQVPSLPAEHPAIVEWRALTVILLDRIANTIRSKLNLSPDQLNLKQVLEAATWKAGREIARHKRPTTGAPPINVISDGTVF